MIDDGTATRELIESIAGSVIAHAHELTELDRVIGDADHGLNLERGFKAVLDRIDAIAALPLGKALAEAGMTLMRSVGGASGPLFGKLFVTVARHVDGARNLSRQTIIEGGEDAVRVLMTLGHSEPGQKTLLDVLVPVLDELRSAQATTTLSQVARRAASAAQATVPMVARRGRAAYLGERSIGHIDPGARSAELIVTAVCRYLERRPDAFT
jgi:dihydroxyacetone kinase-like protein